MDIDLIRQVSNLLNSEMSYTNGWYISESQYEKLCFDTAEKLLRQLQKQGLINSESSQDVSNAPD